MSNGKKKQISITPLLQYPRCLTSIGAIKIFQTSKLLPFFVKITIVTSRYPKITHCISETVSITFILMYKKDHKKEILVVVSGLTPQVVTETLYCLTQTKRPKSNISEIYAITTATGKKTILDKLLNPSKGQFFAFCKEYNIDHCNIKFNNDSIITICNKTHNELDDIRTKEDNAALAKTILSFIKDKTSEKDTILHCSVAGGRKTMSLYLGYALQFYGRPGDTLSHVLISSEFEAINEFYYKPKKDTLIKVKGKHGEVIKSVNTKDAAIELAEIPYIHLRHMLPEKAYLDYDKLVSNMQAELDLLPTPGNIQCNLKDRHLLINEKKVELQPLQFVIYYYFLNCKNPGCKEPMRPACGVCRECYSSLRETAKCAKGLLVNYKTIYGEHSAHYRRLQKKWKQDNLKLYRSLNEYISKINNKIKLHFKDMGGYDYYLISNCGCYGSKRYGIKLDKRKIKIE